LRWDWEFLEIRDAERASKVFKIVGVRNYPGEILGRILALGPLKVLTKKGVAYHKGAKDGRLIPRVYKGFWAQFWGTRQILENWAFWEERCGEGVTRGVQKH